MDFKKLIGTIIGVTLFAVLVAGATFAWLTFGTTIVSDNINAANTMNFLVDYTKGTAIDNIPMVDSTLVTPDQTASLVVVMKRNANSPDGHGYVKLATESGDLPIGEDGKDPNTLTKNGIVRWAICRDTDIEDGIQVDDVCGGATTADEFSRRALNTGKVTAKGEIMLLNDAQLKMESEGAATSGVCPDGAISVKNATTCPSRSATGGSSRTKTYLPTATSAALDSTLIPPTFNTNTEFEGYSNNLGVSYFVYFWLDGETISNDEKNQTYTGYIKAGAYQYQS